MGCGSGCCGPSAEAPSEQTASVQAPIREDADSCCGGASSGVDKDPDQPRFAGATGDDLAGKDGKPDLTASTPCRDACCGEPTVEPQDGVGRSARDAVLDDDCCAPKPTGPSCNKGCCSTPELPCINDTRARSCCEGKAAPCCDQSCLDRLALRECENPEPSLASYGKLANRLHVPCVFLTPLIRRSDRFPSDLYLWPRQGRDSMRRPRP